jgi:hypothetical protein
MSSERLVLQTSPALEVAPNAVKEPARATVSVSVSVTPVHRRSAGTAHRACPAVRPPMNPGERPRTHPTPPPTQLESVLAGEQSGYCARSAIRDQLGVWRPSSPVP